MTPSETHALVQGCVWGCFTSPTLTWSPAAREEEGLLHDTRQVLDIHHQEVVLGDLTRDLNNRGLLEGVGTDEATGHLEECGEV